MEERNYYLLAKDIQNYLSYYQEKFQRKITLAEASIALYEKGCAFSDILEMPDFESWHIGAMDEFRQIYYKRPVEITYFLRHPNDYRSFTSENTPVFSENDMDIVMLFSEDVKIHRHDYFEIAYVLSGSSTLYFENESRHLSSGSCCIIAPYTRHDIQASENAIVLDFLIRKSTFDTAFASILRSDDILSTFFNNCLYGTLKNYLLFEGPVTEHIQQIIKRMLIESFSLRPYSNEVSNCYLSIFLAEILRTHQSVFSYNVSGHKSAASMTLVLTYIKNNYRNNITPDLDGRILQL